MMTKRNKSRRQDARQAAVTLELILALPVFIMSVMAIAEFGLLLSNEVVVEMASRAGAQVASRSNDLSTTNDNDPVPPDVLSAVSSALNQLNVADFTVRVEHNVDGPVVGLQSVVGSGPAVVTPPPVVTLNPSRTYVRVTVYVHSSELTPNVLKTYGLDMDARVSDATAFRRFVW